MKRFGSKKNLFLAYSDYVIELTRHAFQEADLSDQSRLDALKAVFKHAVSHMKDPVELANHTSFYLEGTNDPDLLEKTRYRLRLIDAFTRQMLSQAITNKEIAECDVAMVSRVLQVAIIGAMMIWIKESNRTLEELFDECFQVIFAPLRNVGTQSFKYSKEDGYMPIFKGREVDLYYEVKGEGKPLVLRMVPHGIMNNGGRKSIISHVSIRPWYGISGDMVPLPCRTERWIRRISAGIWRIC